MDIKSIPQKIKLLIKNYRYALIILGVGLIFMLLPEIGIPKQKDESKSEDPLIISESAEEQLCNILRKINGVGEVDVLLTVATEGITHYEADTDITLTGETDDQRRQTVIVTDSERNQSGLVNRQDAPIYRGAVIVCQGGDKPAVCLSVTQAVTSATGLSSDQICVLKMK